MTHDTIDARQTGVGCGPVLDADGAREALLELAAVVRTLFGVELAPGPTVTSAATDAPTTEPVAEPAAEPVVTSETQEIHPAPVEVTIESWETSASRPEQVVASDQGESFVAGAASSPDAEVVDIPAPPVLHARPVPEIAPTTEGASPSDAPATDSADASDSALSAEAAPATDTATVIHAITVPYPISVPTEIPLTAVHADHADHESPATDHSQGMDSRPIHAAFPVTIPLPQMVLADSSEVTPSFHATPASLTDTAPAAITDFARPLVTDTALPTLTDAAAHPAALPDAALLAAPGSEPIPYLDPAEQGLPIPAADVPALAATPDRHSLALLQEIAFLDD